MDALGGYESDDGNEEQSSKQSTSDKSVSSSESEEHTKEKTVEKSGATEVLALPKLNSEPKKRKLLNPFEAMSSVKKSFLSSKAAEDVIAPITDDLVDEPPTKFGISEQSNSDTNPKISKLEKLPSPLDSNMSEAEKRKETVRQRNNRKEKFGQAKFTLKSNRDCPDLWRGT